MRDVAAFMFVALAGCASGHPDIDRTADRSVRVVGPGGGQVRLTSSDAAKPTIVAFPIRVEINRTKATASRSAARFAGHMVLYGAGLLVVSSVLSVIVPGAAMSVVGTAFGEEPGKAAPVLLLMFINIHHYFTDGVIWKISNPEVRKELFAHIQRPAAVPMPPVAAPTNALRPPKRAKARR